MNALIVMAKRLSTVLNAMGQESDLLDFMSATAKNAPEPEGVLVLNAAGQVFKHRHNQTRDRARDRELTPRTCPR